MLLGKSWVVLPNLSAILTKISKMPEMPIFKSYLTASFADWSCSSKSDCSTLQYLIPSTAHRIYMQGSLTIRACWGPCFEMAESTSESNIWPDMQYWSMLEIRLEIINKMGNLSNKSVFFSSALIYPIVFTVPVSLQVHVQLHHLQPFS